MKRITALLTAILFSALNIGISAETITSAIAKETADNFLALDNEWHHATDANIRLVEKEGLAAYYIIEYTAGGWAVVSAQSSSSPIIGYNTAGTFATPAPLSELLDFNANLITTRAKDIGSAEHIGWKRVKQRKAATVINNTPDIAPLITINLNQGYPFNIYCPQINGVNTVVGCVAVGMTQAMMVQGYPPRAVGSYSYTSPNTGTLSINYDAEAAYNWDAIYTCEQTGNYDEVARLLYHTGVSVDMQYGLDGSGTYTELVADALVRNFGYSPRIIRYTKRHPDSKKWLDMILDELSHGRAVVYSGTSAEGGHCWNIDGWKQSTQMVHCNWGWAGYGNGYFSLDNMTDSYQGISFLYDHGAVTGVAAPTATPYDIVLSDTQFALGTEAGSTLSHVETLTTDNNAVFDYETFGPDNVQSPYQIAENKLVSTETLADSDKFKFLRIKATNAATGESYTKDFNINIVSSAVHNLLGVYDASGVSMFDGATIENWQISITVDSNDPDKLWLQPICLFGGLQPNRILPIYAIYNETANTLTMPLGQVLFETLSNKLVTAISTDGTPITSGDMTLQISQADGKTMISFDTRYIFGVGDIIQDGWWYQALINITMTKESNSTAPYGIELSNTTFAIGTEANTKLADIYVYCHDKSATFSYEVFDRQGSTSPYRITDNTLVSSETITESEPFKYMRIKVTNTLTGEACEREFEIQIVENMAGMFEGTYHAYARSAFQGYPDEEWQVNITADKHEANKIWIQPVCLFSGLTADYIDPVYATYDAVKGTISLPLGQTIYEQGDYRMIIATSVNGSDKNIDGNIELQVIQSSKEIQLAFDTNYIFGVGDAITDTWWYQALMNITYTQSLVPPVDITVSDIAGTYNAFANSAFADYPDEEWQVVITTDATDPYKVWIQPVCIFGGLSASEINPIYATLNRYNGTLTMPLGQILYERTDTYRMITGATVDGTTIDTNGYIQLQVTKTDTEVKIAFDPGYIMGVGNAIGNEWWYQALMNITYTQSLVPPVDITVSDIAGTYNAFANSAFADYPDEEWQVVITADATDPDKVWIQPVCIFGGLSASEINPIYATLNRYNGTLTMPLGQILYERTDTYRMITGATVDGTTIDTNGYIQLQVTKTDTEVKIAFDPGYIMGVGNAIGNEWWYQALINITYTQAIVPEIVVDGIYYNITSEEEKTAEVTFKGNTYDEHSDEYTGSIVIPSTITLNGTTYNVTAIGDKAFAKCANLTEVTLPESVTTIGEQAFAACLGLTKVTHSNSITLIKEGSFYQCSNLTDFTFPNGNITIEMQAFSRSGLREVTITSNMTLGQAVFYECNNLSSITIAEGVTTIAPWTFGYSNAFTEISFPGSVATIGDYAFYNCQGLQKINIPANVVSIGTDAFNCNSALESVIVAQDNPVYDSRDNCNALIETATNTLLTGCKNTIIPDNIETIAAWAFGNCIGLTDFVIGNGVTHIGYAAFINCSNLTSIVIPERVVEIDEAAFAYCEALQKIEVKAVNPPVIYEMTFESVDKSLELIVPTESIEVYRTTEYWKDFTNIKGISGITGIASDNNIELHTYNGTIVITGASDNAAVYIYSTSGILLHNTTAGNITSITLPRGIYLVIIDGQTYKAAV